LQLNKKLANPPKCVHLLDKKQIRLKGVAASLKLGAGKNHRVVGDALERNFLRIFARFDNAPVEFREILAEGDDSQSIGTIGNPLPGEFL
jgi:hypothetical protein